MKRLKCFLFALFFVSCFAIVACGSNITLTINFDSKGGSECKSIKYVVGKSFDMPDDPTLDDYVFDGWYTDDGTWAEPLTVNAILNYPLSKSVEITAYAKWLPVTYLNFNFNGGNQVDRVVYDNANTIVPTPVREGYTFSGWYYDNGVWQKQFTLDSLEGQAPKSEITLYAKWLLNRWLNFNSNGGSECGPINVAATADYDLPTPTKKLYIFKGWYMDEGLNTPFDRSLIKFDDYATTVEVYAKWEAKKIQKVTYYGLPKTDYLYGEELELNNMYAVVEYYYYEGERINITEDMVRDFNTTRVVSDRAVNKINDSMYIEIDSENYKAIDYSVSPKYKSISIVENSFKSAYLIGENSECVTIQCDGKPYIGSNYCSGKPAVEGSFSKGIKFKVLATKHDGTTEQLEVVALTSEKADFKMSCGKTHFSTVSRMSFSISYYNHNITDQNGNKIYSSDLIKMNTCASCDGDDYSKVESTAYCDINTQKAGSFTGALYVGLCHADFEYNVSYAEEKVEDFEQSEYAFVKEMPTLDTLSGQVIAITLENGRKFNWTLTEEYITSDFDFETSGSKEVLVQFPFETTSGVKIFKIKYTVVSLSEFEYVTPAEFYSMRNNNGYLQSSNAPYFTYFLGIYMENDEKKDLVFRIPADDRKNIKLDFTTPGENVKSIKIKGVDVALRYSVDPIQKVFINGKVVLGSNVKLADVELLALYSDNYCANLNTQAVGEWDGYNDIFIRSILYYTIYEPTYGENPKQFEYEVIEELDCSSLGQKQAKIKICNTEFTIQYEVVE